MIVAVGPARAVFHPSTWQGSGVCLYQLSSLFTLTTDRPLLIPDFLTLVTGSKPALEICETLEFAVAGATAAD